MKNKKLNIILDLDQTIISSESIDEFDLKKNIDKASKFTYYDMDGYYTVFERPGLQDFLDYLFENFNVSVWTAASKDYALFIIDKIILKNKAGRKLDWFFFSYHCDISKKVKKNTKNLSLLWEKFQIAGYNKNNTIIIDDYDEVFNTQINNCVIAKPFEFNDVNSENDKYLRNLKKTLKNTELINDQPASDINKKLKEKQII